MLPKDPNFRERVADSFARQPAMDSLGIVLADVRPGEVDLVMVPSNRFTQQHGFVHGGVIATALDSACGYAAFSLMSADAEILTVEFKINFVAPAEGERFVFRGVVVKAGRTLTLCEGRGLAVLGEGEKLVATMSATMMAVVGREVRRDSRGHG